MRNTSSSDNSCHYELREGGSVSQSHLQHKRGVWHVPSSQWHGAARRIDHILAIGVQAKTRLEEILEIEQTKKVVMVGIGLAIVAWKSRIA